MWASTMMILNTARSFRLLQVVTHYLIFRGLVFFFGSNLLLKNHRDFSCIIAITFMREISILYKVARRAI